MNDESKHVVRRGRLITVVMASSGAWHISRAPRIRPKEASLTANYQRYNGRKTLIDYGNRSVVRELPECASSTNTVRPASLKDFCFFWKKRGCILQSNTQDASR